MYKPVNGCAVLETDSTKEKEITGLDKILIERCATILQVLNSGYKVNSVKFGEFAMETAKQIVQAYPWFYLPASVHKVLISAWTCYNRTYFYLLANFLKKRQKPEIKTLKF